MDAGEKRKTPYYPHIKDMAPSPIVAIPYWPNLHRQLHSLASCLMVAYLEIHHPAPLDAAGHCTNAPVIVSAGQIATDIQSSRRTLLLTLSLISVFWKDETARARGARVNREFINLDHHRFGTTKPYSITGSKSPAPNVVWSIRRNWPYLNHMLHTAGIFSLTAGLTSTSPDCDAGRDPSCSAQLEPVKSLSELILEHSCLGGDGRRTRPERERRSR